VRPRGSVISQMLMAFSVFAVLIVIAVIAGYVAVRQQNAAAGRLTGRDYLLQQTDRHLQEDFTASENAVTGFALSGQRSALAPLAASRASFDAGLVRLQALAPARLQPDVAAQARAGERLYAVAGEISRVPHAQAQLLAGRTVPIARAFATASKAVQDSMAAEVRRLTSQSTGTLSTALAWSAAAIGVAAVLVLASVLCTLATITRPLRAVAATVRRLTAGDHAARAPLAGVAEVREVSAAVNQLADEADRLRAQEEESSRLREVAREAGLRVRESLITRDVIRRARAVLAEHAGADTVWVALLPEARRASTNERAGRGGVTAGQATGGQAAEGRASEGQASRRPAPGGQAQGSTGAGETVTAGIPPSLLGPAEVSRLEELLQSQRSHLIRDLSEPEAGLLPPAAREWLHAEEGGSLLVTPFGADAGLLGVIVARRRAGGRPWSRAEIDMVESIAADLGRGLHHARLYEQENRLVADLKSLDAARSGFFATVSHELRAPLTSIEGYVELLSSGEAGPVTPRQRTMLDTMERSVSRLRTLIDDVFTLARLEAGARPARRRVNLAEVIAGATETIQPSVASGGLALRVAGLPRDLVVPGDAAQLDQVLLNLLSNAVKFTPEGGSITVTAAPEDDSAVVRVADTGIGVPPHEQPRAFSRFFRGSNAQQRGIAGTGLGLAIVRTIVGMHDGEVSLESPGEGRGTTVTVRLPRAEPETPR
jgi:two-component system phosphate regulon sensor histidine kinase PhoR